MRYTSERAMLVAFIVLVISGCSVVKTPYGESWNFLYDSTTEIEAELVMPDGTKAKVRFSRDVNPNTAAIERLGRGIAEGAVRGAAGRD